MTHERVMNVSRTCMYNIKKMPEVVVTSQYALIRVGILTGIFQSQEKTDNSSSSALCSTMLYEYW